MLYVEPVLVCGSEAWNVINDFHSVLKVSTEMYADCVILFSSESWNVISHFH